MVCQLNETLAPEGSWAFNSATNEGEVQVLPCPTDVCTAGGCGPHRPFTEDNPLCGRCDEGYFEWGSSCLQCETTQHGAIALLGLATWGYLLFLHSGSQKESSNGNVKIFLFFASTTTLIVNNVDLRGSSSLLADILSFFDFRVDAIGSGKGSQFCLAPLNPYQKMAASLFVPLVLVLQLLLTMAAHATFAKFSNLCIQHLSDRLRGLTYFDFTAYVRTLLSVCLFSYTSVSTTLISYLHCVGVGAHTVIFVSPAIACDSPEYIKWRAICITFVVIFVAGLPIFLATFLYASRVRLQHRQLSSGGPDDERKSLVMTLWDAVHGAITGVMCQSYRQDVNWWEVVSIMRRLSTLRVSIA